jgi:spermidine synthase
MFWTIPLALYLATFILAFSHDSWIPRRLTVVGVVLTTAGCMTTYLFPWPIAVRVGLSLLLLFFGSLLCHTDVARDRPRTRDLPRYFLVIAVGGAAGGLLNSVAAPWLFDSVAEFPLTLIALALCLPRKDELAKLLQRQHWQRPQSYVVPVAMLLATAGGLLAVQHQRTAGEAADPASLFILAAILVLGVTFIREPGAFQLGIVIVAVFVLTGLTERNQVILRARSFFSTLKVVETAERRSFVHGGVVHGREYKDPTRNFVLPYYGERAPITPTLHLFPGPTRIGVVGLGAGALASVATREQELIFYELDPLVHTIAEREFSFLRKSKAKIVHVFGDARLTLKDVPPKHFNVLLLDAFSGDGVPMHLLTREATDMYLDKLTPDGLLVFHVSNNYVDLSRVLRGYAKKTGIKMLIARYRPTKADRERGAFVVDAVAMSRSDETLRRLDAIEPWGPLELDGPSVLWTDDHHDIISVMDWARLRRGG